METRILADMFQNFVDNFLKKLESFRNSDNYIDRCKFATVFITESANFCDAEFWKEIKVPFEEDYLEENISNLIEKFYDDIANIYLLPALEKECLKYVYKVFFIPFDNPDITKEFLHRFDKMRSYLNNLRLLKIEVNYLNFYNFFTGVSENERLAEEYNFDLKKEIIFFYERNYTEHKEMIPIIIDALGLSIKKNDDGFITCDMENVCWGFNMPLCWESYPNTWLRFKLNKMTDLKEAIYNYDSNFIKAETDNFLFFDRDRNIDASAMESTISCYFKTPELATEMRLAILDKIEEFIYQGKV